jgi:hypothetical protein
MKHCSREGQIVLQYFGLIYIRLPIQGTDIVRPITDGLTASIFTPVIKLYEVKKCQGIYQTNPIRKPLVSRPGETKVPKLSTKATLMLRGSHGWRTKMLSVLQ